MDTLITELLRIETLLVFVLAVLVAALLGIVTYVGVKLWVKASSDAQYHEQFNSLFISEFDSEETKEDNSLGAKWNRYWKERTQRAGIKRYSNEDKDTPGRDLIIATLVIGLFVGLISTNPFIGIIAFACTPLIYNVILGLKINSIQSSLNAQVPPFLAAFKANIQARKTPEKALISVIDEIGEPLRTELIPIKQRLQSGVDLPDALEELKERTTSKELQFLSTCIKIASKYGADLEDQIEIIQRIIAERQNLANKLATASGSARLPVILASVLLPGLFIGIYLFYDQAQDFWFRDPISYLALILIIIFYAAGMFFTKKLVDGVKKL